VYAADHASATPDKPAVIMAGSGESLTFSEYEARANRAAHMFRDLGLRRGDHIAIFLANNPRLFELEGAAERTGLYFTCVNSYLQAGELAYIVNDCRARVLVASAATREVALAAAQACPAVELFLEVDALADDGPFQPYEQVVGGYPSEPVPDEELGAAMLYSSGTTGKPKGILRPLPAGHPAEPLPVMSFIQDVLFHMRPGMVYLSPTPLFHSAPQASVAAAFRLGATSIVMERFDPEWYLELVQRYRVTHSQVVPTMFSRMLKLPEHVRSRYDVSSLEVVVHAAAPCPVPVKQAMLDWFGPVLREYYGATEANGFTVCTSQEWREHPGSVGRPVLGEVEIRDDEARLLPAGEPGTVWFRGATNFEYFGDPDKTAASRDATGEASTIGDVGHLDAAGYLYLTDRKYFMIISGGVNVYPQETEDVLVTHAAVADAAVIGVPNPDLGEEVKAVVQPAEAHAAGPDLERRLQAFCRERLASIKCPRSVDFVAELPRLPTGKLYKSALRERYRDAAPSIEQPEPPTGR
jgi:acyl-CoA synthetase (AMP-forming)/AMP-acid ligase II